MREEVEEQDQDNQPPTQEHILQGLRIKAAELFLREEWQESVQVYTQFIDLCQEHIFNSTHYNPPNQDELNRLRKSLCLALSNRAEARSRLRGFTEALEDCDQALEIESTHFKSLVCKGKILLSLNRYSAALGCFKTALLDPQANGNVETLKGYVEKCKKLDIQSKTGTFDLSDWILNGFRGKSPELAEFIGAVEIKRSGLSGRGLFATKNMETGTLLLATKAIATERCILSSEDSAENAQMVMWKSFIDKVAQSTAKSKRISLLLSTLSTGEEEDKLQVPEISLFRPDADEIDGSNEKLGSAKILNILDVNSLVEDSVSAKVLGKNSEYYGVGLWVLASFINHSCNPNARRLHVGDYLLVHASRDIKAGEEITFAYFDVLSPLEKRKEMSKTWGFHCSCRRCKFEEEVSCKQEIQEIEMGLERGIDVGGAIFRLEEGMRRWMMRGKEKGYLRSSFWGAYFEAYSSEKVVKKWGRKIPNLDAVVDSVAEATGSDERGLKMLMELLKKNSFTVIEMEKVMKLGKGVFGKIARKQVLKSLLELSIRE